MVWWRLVILVWPSFMDLGRGGGSLLWPLQCIELLLFEREDVVDVVFGYMFSILDLIFHHLLDIPDFLHWFEYVVWDVLCGMWYVVDMWLCGWIFSGIIALQRCFLESLIMVLIFIIFLLLSSYSSLVRVNVDQSMNQWMGREWGWCVVYWMCHGWAYSWRNILSSWKLIYKYGKITYLLVSSIKQWMNQWKHNYYWLNECICENNKIGKGRCGYVGEDLSTHGDSRFGYMASKIMMKIIMKMVVMISSWWWWWCVWFTISNVCYLVLWILCMCFYKIYIFLNKFKGGSISSKLHGISPKRCYRSHTPLPPILPHIIFIVIFSIHLHIITTTTSSSSHIID